MPNAQKKSWTANFIQYHSKLHGGRGQFQTSGRVFRDNCCVTVAAAIGAARQPAVARYGNLAETLLSRIHTGGKGRGAQRCSGNGAAASSRGQRLVVAYAAKPSHGSGGSVGPCATRPSHGSGGSVGPCATRVSSARNACGCTPGTAFHANAIANKEKMAPRTTRFSKNLRVIVHSFIQGSALPSSAGPTEIGPEPRK